MRHTIEGSEPPSANQSEPSIAPSQNQSEPSNQPVRRGRRDIRLRDITLSRSAG